MRLQKAHFEEIDSTSLVQPYGLARPAVVDGPTLGRDAQVAASFDTLSHRGNRHRDFHIIEGDTMLFAINVSGEVNSTINPNILARSRFSALAPLVLRQWGNKMLVVRQLLLHVHRMES